MNMKKKLVAATAMMLISALMLTSVSFAWVTLSTNPEVKGITATAAANGNLEIAVNKQLGTLLKPSNDTNTDDDNVTGHYYSYGNMVEFQPADGGNANAIKLPAIELRQAEFVATTGAVTTTTGANSYLKTYQYGTDGRKNSSVQLTDGAYADTAANKKAGVVLVTGDPAGDGGSETIAARFDYWLRTNEAAGVLTLSDAVKRDANISTATWDGAGSTITVPTNMIVGTGVDAKPAVKVAFVITKEGTGTATVVANADLTYTRTAADSTTFKIGHATDKNLLASMDANANYLVQMYVYLDGSMVTNEMLAAETTGIAVNVQFANSKVGSGDGKTNAMD